MMWASGPVGAFVERHPTIKMLALSFLILIGVALVGEGVGFHIRATSTSRWRSLIVEILNMRMRRKRAGTGQLHNQPAVDASG